ncbi:hypothetical protein B0H14DRAFT_3606075 [Mycena olivaceomarginata]|nr:hypothetical protein B0H14DRAFT_3606075 [Mycena olivaceomarginata]
MFSKLRNIILDAAAVVTPVFGTPTCDTTGPTFSCQSVINTFCAEAAASPPVLVGGSEGRCYPVPTGTTAGGHCTFTAKNTALSPLVPVPSQCVAALNQIAAACPQFKLIALAVALVAPATASVLERAAVQPCCIPRNYPCPFPPYSSYRSPHRKRMLQPAPVHPQHYPGPHHRKVSLGIEMRLQYSDDGDRNHLNHSLSVHARAPSPLSLPKPDSLSRPPNEAPSIQLRRVCATRLRNVIYMLHEIPFDDAIFDIVRCMNRAFPLRILEVQDSLPIDVRQ